MKSKKVSRRSLIAGAVGSALAAATRVEGQLSDPTTLTLEEASRRIRSRQLSSLDLTRAYLARIERLNPRINAFITVTSTQALEQAAALDKEMAAGRRRGPLHGIPIAQGQYRHCRNPYDGRERVVRRPHSERGRPSRHQATCSGNGIPRQTQHA